jgi:FHA domain
MNHPLNNFSAKVKGFFLTQPEAVIEQPPEKPPITPPPPPTTPKPIEALLSAMGRALSQRYAEADIPMMVSVAPNVRFKLDLIAAHQTVDNSQALSCIEGIPPNILEAVLLRQLGALPFAKYLDLSQFCGLAIIPAPETREFGMIEEVMRIGMSSVHIGFSFDGQIIELADTDKPTPPDTDADTAHKPPAHWQSAMDHHFHLRMKQGMQGAWQAVAIDTLPMVLGKQEGVECLVAGDKVSGKHAILDWDDSLQCMRLTDRSTNGTFVDVKGSAQSERLTPSSSAALIDKAGRFTLTSEADAPVFEYWYGETQDEAMSTTTPMSSMTYVELPPPQPSQPDVKPKTAVDVPTATAQPITEQPLQPELPEQAAKVTKMSSMTQVDLPAQVTHMQGMRAVTSNAPKALAMIQMRLNGSSDIQTMAITSLPFCIGREFAGAGLRVPEACLKVSRKHLMLDKQHGGGFYADNLAHKSMEERNGCYQNGAEQIKRFFLATAEATQDSGWLVLGAATMDEETAEIRVVAA